MLPVDPGPGRRPADERRRLGDLVLVVGEDVIDAAGVEVKPVAEVATRHRGAFEVPPWVAVAPARGRPFQRATRTGGLPQREIGRVALVWLDLAAMTGPEVVERVARQPPIP